MEEARNVTQSAEEDIDEAVSGADTGFNPDGDGREEDGEKAEEYVAAAHDFAVQGLDVGMDGENQLCFLSLYRWMCRLGGLKGRMVRESVCLRECSLTSPSFPNCG